MYHSSKDALVAVFARHLPATLLASFVKRLARLSLSAPPSSIVIVIPFVYNVLKRHPALMIMIHREEGEDGDSSEFSGMHHLVSYVFVNLSTFRFVALLDAFG